MTIDEIAKKANVAKSTVSNVLNGKACVSDKTREKVLQICRKCNYQPNFYSRNLSNSKSEVKTNIASIFLDSENNDRFASFYLQLLKGTITGLKSFDYDLLVNYHQFDHDIENRLRAGSSPIDGAIILTPRKTDLRISSLNNLLIPFVVIGSTDDKNICYIDVDNKKLVCVVSKAMIKNGFTNICLINSEKDLTISKDRVSGLKEACKHNKYQVVFNSDDINYDKTITTLINEGVNGFITSDARKAKKIYEVCEKLSKKIGKDVAVFSLGYSFTIGMDSFVPRLSYAYQDYVKIGQLASEMLIKKISGEKPDNIIINSEIYWGESLPN